MNFVLLCFWLCLSHRSFAEARWSHIQRLISGWRLPVRPLFVGPWMCANGCLTLAPLWTDSFFCSGRAQIHSCSLWPSAGTETLHEYKAHVTLYFYSIIAQNVEINQRGAVDSNRQGISVYLFVSWWFFSHSLVLLMGLTQYNQVLMFLVMMDHVGKCNSVAHWCVFNRFWMTVELCSTEE